MAGTLRSKAPGVTDKSEKVRFPERSVVKFHDDDVAVGRDLADGPSRFNLLLLAV